MAKYRFSMKPDTGELETDVIEIDEKEEDPEKELVQWVLDHVDHWMEKVE